MKTSAEAWASRAAAVAAALAVEDYAWDYFWAGGHEHIPRDGVRLVQAEINGIVERLTRRAQAAAPKPARPKKGTK